MQLLRDRILIRITKENRESIYSKKITREDGTVVNLWKTIPTKDDVDERASALMIQTGIVEEVSSAIDWIKKGDIALMNYDVCNSPQNFIKKDGDDSIYFLNVNTTYHKEDQIAYQTRKSRRDQIVFLKDDYNELSSLLGILRDEELIANDPYVFFDNESVFVSRVSKSGILYTEKRKIFDRKVIAASAATTERFGIKKGDIIKVKEADTFSIKLDEDHTIDAVNDVDILMLVH